MSFWFGFFEFIVEFCDVFEDLGGGPYFGVLGGRCACACCGGAMAGGLGRAKLIGGEGGEHAVAGGHGIGAGDVGRTIVVDGDLCHALVAIKSQMVCPFGSVCSVRGGGVTGPEMPDTRRPKPAFVSQPHVCF